MTKIIAQGAEAIIELEDNKIIKKRIKKTYRIEEIDSKLRKSRTKKEAKILEALPIPGPKLIRTDTKNTTIIMEYLKGQKIADVFEKIDYIKISKEIGEKLIILHNKDIIHGDLTTSNMILNNEVYFIDFGLSFISDKIEDKAVDLHLIKQALESKHYKIWKDCYNEILKSYGDKKVIKRLDKIELRGRHKNK
ncbi:Kae1-associated serine/threonine protein kinase [Candidatus Woesearchaeota archaeon]|jgi:Kae1-associated kinase Bud32|nr:Kae1-associated serine/threonine protein kinase [Candidatus Woesearchaeota archaeon]